MVSLWLLFQVLLCCDTVNIGPKVLKEPTAKLETHSYLRNKTTGYYFRLQSIIKPLRSHTIVCGKTNEIEPSSNEDSILLMCRSPRYFGSNAGQFIHSNACVMLVLWNPLFGITYAFAEAGAIADTFDLINPEDVEGLGRDIPVCYTGLVLLYVGLVSD